MLESIRRFLTTPAGKVVSLVLLLLAGFLVFQSARNSFSSEAAAVSTDRIYVCTESGKTFKYTIKPGDTSIVMSPHSRKKTGVLAEVCYWTKEGTVGKEPTYVLLNQHKGQEGPTFCPTCGRLVVVQNPPAIPGDKPPPTEPEYKNRRPQE